MTDMWGRLRAQHQEVTDARDPLYLDDPVHDGVVYRYRYVPIESTKRATKKIAKIRDQTDQTIAGAIETILLAIDEIMVMAPDGEIPVGNGGQRMYPQPLKPLADEGEPPMKFDQRLAAGMGFSEDTASRATRIVRAMFAENAYVIIDHAAQISAWMSEVAPEVREDFQEQIVEGR